MKLKFVCVLAALGIVLAVMGTANAVSLQQGPSVWKTWNYEVGTAYQGGLVGSYYFRTATTTYDTEEGGLLKYGDRPTDRLFTGNANPADDLIIAKDPALRANEDTFGLLRVTNLFGADILGPSRFDGPGILGNDMSANLQYWSEGSGGDYLHGILWGNQDQVIEVLSPGNFRIWGSGGQYEIWETDSFSYNPAVPNPATSPAARPVADNRFPGWFDDTTDELAAGGSIGYFRFQGTATSPLVFDGNTEVLFDVTSGKFAGAFTDWWYHPDGVTTWDLWQSWNIGDPFVFSNGWVGSEDSARGYVIPEPVTMLGLFIGLTSLVGYSRKRFV
jgi:hypothetical protein